MRRENKTLMMMMMMMMMMNGVRGDGEGISFSSSCLDDVVVLMEI
jgi:hypothetical protein